MVKMKSSLKFSRAIQSMIIDLNSNSTVVTCIAPQSNLLMNHKISIMQYVSLAQYPLGVAMGDRVAAYTK